jgi:Ser/Thr protein kinase RdoA (MazF antagonist)
LGGSTLRGVADRLRGPLRDGVPRSVEDIDALWIEQALQGSHPGAKVEALARAGGHSGTTTRERFEVVAPGTGIESLFVKITPVGWPQRIFGHAMRLGEMEVRFYQELAERVPVRTPHVYAARATPGHERFVLLLEDVAGSGTRFVELGDRAGEAEARAVVTALASLHAAFWESPRFESDLAWLRCLERRGAELPIERFLTAQMVTRAVRRHGAAMPPCFERAAVLVSDHRDVLEATWSAGPRTLVHGDCHIGNLFFEGDTVGFLDWQVLARAPGLRDVGYFLSNSVPSEVAEKHEADLIELYCGELRAAGIDAPAAEVAWRQYRAFALYGWLAAAFTVGAGGMQDERNASAGLLRATRSIERLGSTEVFDL